MALALSVITQNNIIKCAQNILPLLNLFRHFMIDETLLCVVNTLYSITRK